MKLKSKNLMILFSIIFISLIIIFPEISKSGISRGLILTTNIVIPSLFPFLVCVLMIMKSNITVNNYYINNLIYKVFGYNFNVFFVFVLSLLGGYPVGAKLINELVKNNYKEIVLTGIHTGNYGCDLGIKFSQLLNALSPK